jgi:alpha-glucosidase
MKSSSIFFAPAVAFTLTLVALPASPVDVTSPNGRHVLKVEAGNGQVSYSITSGGQAVISPTPISITIDGVPRPQNPAAAKVSRRKIHETVKPPVPTIASSLVDSCNEALLTFKDGVALRCRAYDDGVAFRWECTLGDKQVTVNDESLAFSFAEDFQVYFPESHGKGFFSHQENQFHRMPVSKTAKMKMACVPLLVELGDGGYLLISDVNVEGYPGLWIEGANTEKTLPAVFPPYPLETKLRGDRSLEVARAADFLARTSGNRSFPWRGFVVADAAGLLTSTLLYHLAEPSRIDDTSWIVPGKVAWDWWNYNNIHGVPFRAGINQDTYKHYIDFAAEMDIPYIILDEGWSVRGPENLLKVVPEINMQALADYGRSKDVDLVLWMTSAALEQNFDTAFAQFSEWGIAGLKVDFMQRDDQVMMDFLYRTAEEAAQRKLLLDFHGGSKPAGLLRTWPNVLTHESVLGLEQNKWSENANPELAVLLPFLRMVVGPMDYTPGAMVNLQKKDFKPMFQTPASQGTRCHQLAMYVVYLSPLQMLADTPTNYRRNPESLPFLREVPVTWDETRVLQAAVGESLVVARRNGNRWFIGGLTNWNAREFELPLDFLADGPHGMTTWKDGPNADRNGNDVSVETSKVGNQSTLSIQLAPGGGVAAMIEPAN